MRTLLFTALALAALPLVACGGSSQGSSGRTTTSGSGSSRRAAVDDHGRCEIDDRIHEVSEYDTSGDDVPDVRRVYRRAGDPPELRLVLICREADLNGDGIKDMVRFYNDDGRPLREEVDRNFDGQIDTITYFQEGRIIRQESDENGDGRVDAKVFFNDDGTPLRAERDLAGRSTATEWRPDRWEYFENGRTVRMGTDIDGDGRVDRWDRNRDLQQATPAETVDDGDDEAEG